VSDILDDVEVTCRFMNAGDIARQAMDLVKHERDSWNLWRSLTMPEKVDLTSIVQGQLIRLLENPDTWLPAVTSIRGERLDILIAIPFQQLESRPLGDRLVTMERVKDDLVRALAELRASSPDSEEEDGTD
jgi:hypothetical protein